MFVERPRRHGPDAGSDADGPAALARAGADARDRRLRFELNVHQPVQPEDGDAHLQLLEQGRRCAARVVGDRPVEHRPDEGLRLQRADPGDAGRRERLRSALRAGRPLQTGAQGQFSVKFTIRSRRSTGQPEGLCARISALQFKSGSPRQLPLFLSEASETIGNSGMSRTGRIQG